MCYSSLKFKRITTSNASVDDFIHENSILSNKSINKCSSICLVSQLNMMKIVVLMFRFVLLLCRTILLQQ